MRILMISDVYFPRINGVSTSIQTFARELVSLGVYITLLVPDYGANIQHNDTQEIFSIHRIPSRSVPFDPEDRMLKFNAILALVPNLSSLKFDLLHIHTPFIAHYGGLALAQKLGLPIIETCHTHFEEYLNHYIPFLPKKWLQFGTRKFAKWQSNQVNALIAPSQAMLEVLRGYGITIPIETIPTGVNVPTNPCNGNRERFRQKYNIALDRPTLIHVGRLAYEKNQSFLLDVLLQVKSQIPDILLIFVGEGPSRHVLELRSHKLGLSSNTLFVGYLERHGPLQDCYCAGDLFVFSSRTETQGLVLLEAMAYGLPIVSTAVMGTKEVLQDGQGVLIVKEEITEFANYVVKILQDSKLQQALSNKARIYAKQWSIPVLTKRLLAYYKQVINNDIY
ncbi:glycosyl transferase family 1 [Achromatium sp. WMS3]|nr:glycosyl transferase family 1 [Achromatium sp. WMS3]